MLETKRPKNMVAMLSTYNVHGSSIWQQHHGLDDFIMYMYMLHATYYGIVHAERITATDRHTD